MAAVTAPRPLKRVPRKHVLIDAPEAEAWMDDEDAPDDYLCHLGKGPSGTVALCGAKGGLVMPLAQCKTPEAPNCEACHETRCAECLDTLREGKS